MDLNVFVPKGVIAEVSTATIFQGVTPFWSADLLCLVHPVTLLSLVLFLPISV